MKRILKKTLPVMFALVLISASALSVSAETVKGTVTYDGDAVALNYSTKDIKEALSGLTPGDDVELEFTLKNNSNKATDWYVEDSVIKAFEEGIEETTEGTNGAYEYNLVYTSASGKSTGIYSNEVGGDNSGTTVPKGLKQASSGSDRRVLLSTTLLLKGRMVPVMAFHSCASPMQSRSRVSVCPAACWLRIKKIMPRSVFRAQ